jgi:hypothetical protein
MTSKTVLTQHMREWREKKQEKDLMERELEEKNKEFYENHQQSIFSKSELVRNEREIKERKDTLVEKQERIRDLRKKI